FNGSYVPSAAELNSFFKNKIADAATINAITGAIKRALALKVQLLLINSSENLHKLILKYGSLIAAIAEAKNSEEVTDAIESAALPVGSARIKKVSAWNI